MVVNLMNKNSQFESFLSRLRRGEEINYNFFIDLEWLERHDRLENFSADWIEVITERLTDDGSNVISFRWRFDSEQKNIVLERSDDDSQWFQEASFNIETDMEDLKDFFEVVQ